MQGLVLFDIDGTLLRTDGAGMMAMEEAGKELFGPGFSASGVSFAGSLDPIILRQMLDGCGVKPSREIEARSRGVYRERLRARLAASTRARALPGAGALVAAARNAGHLAVGVLTGNYAETGGMKLKACGLEPAWFEICAWGDDSPHDPPDREHLPPVAMERFRARYGREVEPDRVTIIGDTSHDIRCARASGCRSIGVATGVFTARALSDAGADFVVEDLSETAAIVSMLA